MIQSSKNQHHTTPPWAFCEVPVFPEYPRIKRFLDRYRLDDAFRKTFQEDPRSVVVDLGIDLSPEDLGKFLDPRYVGAPSDGTPERPAVSPADSPRELIEFLDLRDRQQAERIRRRDELGPIHGDLAAWRRRQIARCRLQLPTVFYDSIMHGPFAIELSSGCSAGCWFCAVSAEDFKGHFPHRPDEATMFRGVLEALHELLGTEFASEGVMYWATDPLDNPDYERFLDDFVLEFGRAPTTTTSLAAIDLDRTQRLLERIAKEPCWFQRFSIVKKGDVARILDRLSPEETVNVDFLPVFSKLQPLTRSGRALEVAMRQDERGQSAPAQLLDQESTCACTTGFLLNMVDRTVTLISPHPATPDAPHGYLEFGTRTFTDPESFSLAIHDLARSVGEACLSPEDVVEVPYGLKLTEDGPRVIAVHGQSCVLRLEHPAVSTMLVDRLGPPTSVGMLAQEAFDPHGRAQIFDLLNQLHHHGALMRSEDAGVSE